jgi:hypothetical protein
MQKQPATRAFASGRMSDLLNVLHTGQLAPRKTTAEVSFEDDPKVPGRRAYRITGDSKRAVQMAIDARMNALDFANGHGNFIGPYREGEGFVAIGEIVIPPEPAP